jgi:hypothetical protein
VARLTKAPAPEKAAFWRANGWLWAARVWLSRDGLLVDKPKYRLPRGAAQVSVM